MNIKQSSAISSITPAGEFIIEHWRGGKMINLYRIPNGVANEGKNNLLNTNFDNGTQNVFWWMGLIDSIGYSSLSAVDIYSSLNLYAAGLTSPSWRYYWFYRKQITIDNTNVGASDLLNQPICVKINADADFQNATATGYDIRFTSSDGATLLSYERESWSGGNGSAATAVFWVKVPTVSHTATTIIYIYYGNASAPDGQSTISIWDTNYKGVWHLGETATGTAGDFKDSSAYVNNSTNTAIEPVRAAGQIGYGQNFDSARNIAVPKSASLAVTSLTLSFWANPTNATAANMVGFDSGYVVGIGRPTASTVGAYCYLNVGWRAFDFQYPVSLTTWTAFTFTYDSTTGDAKLYVNGVYYATFNYAGNYPIATTGTWNGIGGYNGSLFYTGIIDEVRVSNILRPVDQLNFEYLNQSSGTNELTWGAQSTFTALTGNNWLEFTSYTDTNNYGSTTTRPQWITSDAASQSITNTIKSLFDITASGTIVGVFLVGGPNAQTKGNNAGGNTLWATALFAVGSINLTSGDIAVEPTDQLRVVYTITV